MLLDLATSVAAVTALIAKHPLLPADEITPSANGLRVDLHGGFADFEAWREALGVPTENVTFRNNSGGTTMRTETEFAGLPLTLVGYSDHLPQTAAPLKAVA